MVSMKFDSYQTIPLVTYLLLATGTVFPTSAFGLLFPLHTIAVIMFLFLFSGRPGFGHCLVFVNAMLFPMAIVYMISGLRSADPNLLIERLEGAFIVSILVATLVGVYVIKYGEKEFQRVFIIAAIFILILTVVFKVQTGFFDRGQRFFLNGPIVFGWLMGVGAVIAIIRVVDRQYTPIFGLALAACFATAVFWSASKGPVIGLLVACAYIIISRLRSKRVYFYSILAVVLAVSIFRLMPEDMAQRYLVIGRVFNASLEQDDFGSVGIRFLLWSEAIRIFLDNPVFGVGAGNWQFKTTLSELVYPHNMTLELAAETGLLGLAFYILLIAILFVKLSFWVRVTLLYFITCTSFSGDFYYFRFIVGIPLGLLAASSYFHKNLKLRETQ